MQDLQALVPLLIFLALLMGLSLAQHRLRRAARFGTGEAAGRPPAEPVPERLRLPPQPQPPLPPPGPEPAPRPEALFRLPPAARARGAPAAVPAPPTIGTRRRTRRLLRDPRGRRAAILAHEILGPPGGLGGRWEG